MPLDRPQPRVALSTSSVYPETTATAFDVARKLGYDGVELMVGIDPSSADVDAVERLRDYHEVPVLALHAPTLLVTQRIWGPDPWEKLERSAHAATRLGADVVVVHPPFRWQRGYAAGFAEGIRALTEATGITFTVENMYPWRGPGGGELRAYSPGWDPSDLDYDHLTLDLSHASTARLHSLDLLHDWGERLRHVHLTDGTGLTTDEHLLPGDGDQRAADVLRMLTRQGYRGHVVVEVSTRRAASRLEQEAQLNQALDFARTHLSTPVPEVTR